MQKQGGERLKLFPSCKLVKGASHSAIYDLERRKLFRFENSWLPLIAWVADEEGFGIHKLNEIDQQGREKCALAISFLKDNELVYNADIPAGKLSEFPLEWHMPHKIQSALIDVVENIHEWEPLLEQLEKLGCRSLQIRSFSNDFDLNNAISLLENLAVKGITHIYLLVSWGESWEGVDWGEMFGRYRNLVEVKIHSAPMSKTIQGKELLFSSPRFVRLTTEKITGPNCCGDIDASSLSFPRANLFSELQSFNGCLNRKVSIRSDGEICNCPSMQTTFGKNVNKLNEIVSSESFRKIWFIRKDDISDCQVCEYRYVCSDCRAYFETDFSTQKPTRCGYDPRSGIWKSKTDTGGGRSARS